ncbi:MAG: hypothetical protein AVO33_05690 [delta proteobacterium ML8_F1]|nr:MAG: hypothetical protein AVO33_05690 [delta proteobacterium ML8_F1]
MLEKILTEENFKALDELLNRYEKVPGPLMPLLQGAQDIFTCIPEEVQSYIAQKARIPLAEIYGVVTFYSQFRMTPRGENVISVCLGTACYVKGSQHIMDRISKDLGIGIGETSKDGRFTLVGTRCIGACGLAPIVTVNEDVYGKVKEAEILKILKKYK